MKTISLINNNTERVKSHVYGTPPPSSSFFLPLPLPLPPSLPFEKAL